MCTINEFHFRNPDPNLRPTFLKIVVALQRPDYKILHWSTEDTNTYSEQARSFGAPLSDGLDLYLTLQQAYINTESKAHTESKSDLELLETLENTPRDVIYVNSNTQESN